MRAVVVGALSSRRVPVETRMPAGLQSRTGLPVVSNRAFVAAWVARRSRLVAAARWARANS